MTSTRRGRGASHPALLLLALLLAGCSFADETILPTLSGENARGGGAARAGGGATAEGDIGAAAPGEDRPAAAGGASRDPVAGDLARVESQLAARRAELAAIRARLSDAESRYDQAASAVESGARSGDPRVAAQRAEAETQLARVASGVARLNTLSASTASDGTLASSVVQAARARMAGEAAPARDARAAELDRRASRAAADADALLVEIGGDIAEHSRRIGADRRRLAGGGVPVVPVAAPAAASAAPAPGAASRRPGERRALVTIRFDQADTEYQAALAGAVRQALQRRPDLGFDIVAVNPPGTPPADAVAASRRNMEGVVRTLAGLGVSGDRMRLSSTVDPLAAAPEVRLYPR